MLTRASYIAVETLISVIINTALSIGFAFLVFHGHAHAGVTGLHGIVVDMAPQTFMIVLMSFFVPALLTRKRLAAGALAWHTPPDRARTFHTARVAITIAIASTCVVVALSWLVLPWVLPSGASFVPLLIAKALYGATLAAIVTPRAIHAALR